jgi:hypothetical protein
MTPDRLVAETESELRLLASALTDPRESECLLCYVRRMLEHGCDGTHRWATRFRDLRAPRVQGLERRLGSMGACCCDCEIFLNAYVPAPQQSDRPAGAQPSGCLGARAGSTKGCALWVRRRRRGW